MKKIAIVIFTLLSFLGKSQFTLINIWEIQKDTINLGESVWIGFKEQDCGSTGCPNVDIYLDSPSIVSIPSIWDHNESYIHSLSTYTNSTGNTLYKDYITIPTSSTPGINRLLTSANGTPGGYVIYINNQIDGIKKYNNNNPIKIYYKSILGEDITNFSSGIIYIRYSEYQDKSVVVDKVIY